MTIPKINTKSSFEIGIECHKAGDLFQAELHYRQAISKKENSTKARNYLGMIHFAKGNFSAAIDFWKESIQEDANYIEPLVNLAFIRSYSSLMMP